MVIAQKTCNLCILTIIAFGLNLLSNRCDTVCALFISVFLSILVVIGSIFSKDKGRYIRWFLMAVNGLYVFFFGLILWVSKCI